ncbi:hypothetical protein ACLOJK_029349 [Asimina triloba]
MPPRKVPCAIPSLEVAKVQSTIPQRDKTGLPSPLPQQPPDGITVGAPEVLLPNPLEVVTQHEPDEESPVTRANNEGSPTTTLALTTVARLAHALKYTPVGAFDDPNSVAPNRTPGGCKRARPVDRISPDLGGTTLCSHGGSKRPPPHDDILDSGSSSA